MILTQSSLADEEVMGETYSRIRHHPDGTIEEIRAPVYSPPTEDSAPETDTTHSEEGSDDGDTTP